MTTYPPKVETLRRPWRAAIGAAGLAAVAVFFVAGIPSAAPVGQMILIVLAGLAVVAAVRMARSGVYVTEDGITVRDTLRTRQLGWRQIQEISAASDDQRFRTLGIVTTDGRRVRCYALSTAFLEDPASQRFQVMHERLSRQLRHARAAGRASVFG
ncbi:MAG TPA: PH domain-containing protein [Micromonosporaceae bacterium]|nr:PH domain-containing protein [Micromonosporaceae bacterium]